MTYEEILKHLSVKENISVKEIENEMESALHCVGLNCSAKEFIATTANLIKKDYI